MSFFRLGESCSHIGAILFKVEAAVRLGYTKVACTDVSCQWNNDFIKKIEGIEIKKIKFYKKSEIKKPIKRTFSEASEREQNTLLKNLKLIPAKEQPVALSLFYKYSESFHHKAAVPMKPKIPVCLRKFFGSDIQPEELDEKIDQIYSLQISPEDKNFIENATKKQGQSLEWKEMRVGRITASISHDVLHTKLENPSKSLITRICTISSPLTIPAVLWGVENESTALSEYEKVFNNSHENVKIRKSGLRLDKYHHVLGASADAIGFCKCHGDFLIEIKCPFKHKSQNKIEDCTTDSNFCLNKDLNLKESHKYMTQVQMQMYIYNIQKCHFVIWTPQF